MGRIVGTVSVLLTRAAAPATFAATLLTWLGRFGYLGVALGVLLESAGLPIPGEAALLAAAFGAARGALALPWVIAVAALAGVLGDNLGFALGRRLGREWLRRHGGRFLLEPERLAQVDRFFDRYGAPTVAIARFVTGVRVVAAFAAGTTRLRWRTFLLWNVIGAVAWASTVGLVGYAVGKGYAQAGEWFGRAGVVLGLVVPAALLAAWLLRRVAVGDVARRLRPGWLSGAAAQWLVVLGVSGAAVASFAMLAEEVGERETAPFDAAVRAWTLAHHPASLVPVFDAFTVAGSTPVIGTLAALAALWLWRTRGVRLAAAAIATPLVALAVIGVLKVTFHRMRPPGAFLDPGLAHALHYSFPSGHSTGSMAIALTLAYVLVRERIAPRWSLALAPLFAVLVGLSRIYLDVHWATDVIGGWAVGLALASGGAALYDRVRRTRP